MTQNPNPDLPLSVEIGQCEIKRFSGGENALMHAPGSILLEIALARLWVEVPQARATILKINAILNERYKKRGEHIFS